MHLQGARGRWRGRARTLSPATGTSACRRTTFPCRRWQRRQSRLWCSGMWRRVSAAPSSRSSLLHGGPGPPLTPGLSPLLELMFGGFRRASLGSIFAVCWFQLPSRLLSFQPAGQQLLPGPPGLRCLSHPGSKQQERCRGSGEPSQTQQSSVRF